MSAERQPSKVIAVSLSAEMAQQAEAIAKEEQRSVSELFRQAFLDYRAARLKKLLKQTGKIAKAQAADIRSEEDIERIVKATRAELELVRAPKREVARE